MKRLRPVLWCALVLAAAFSAPTGCQSKSESGRTAEGGASPSSAGRGASGAVAGSDEAGGTTGSAGRSGGTAGTAAKAGNGEASGGGSGGAGASGASGQGGSTGGTGGMGGSARTGGTGGAAGGTAGAATGGSMTAGASGSGGSGGGAGASSTATYNPCPPQGTACTVVPLGDSITNGYSATDEGGYRSRLFRLALADGKSMTFTGSASGGPETVSGVPFPDGHEGHNGIAIDELVPIAMSLGSAKPHIVIVMAGANGADPDETTAMAKLIDALTVAAPQALVVVSQMLPFADGQDAQRIATFNANIPGLVKQRADAGKHVVTVDPYHPFLANPNYSKEYLVDYAHPTDAGYEVMAKTFYQVIGPLLR